MPPETPMERLEALAEHFAESAAHRAKAEGFAASATYWAENAADLRWALSEIDRLTADCARKDDVIRHVQQSLTEQALARADPTMPRLTSTVLEQLRSDAEVNYALAETREERVAAHGLSLLCDWQDAAAASARSEGRTDAPTTKDMAE